MKVKLHKLAALLAGAALALGTCAHADITPGQVLPFTSGSKVTRPFRPISWPQFHGGIGASTETDYSQALIYNPSATPTTTNPVQSGYNGIYGSTGTPMFVPNTTMVDTVMQLGAAFPYSNPLFAANGTAIDDFLNRWLLIDPTPVADADGVGGFHGTHGEAGTQIAGNLLGDYWDPANFEPPFSRNVFRDWNVVGWGAPNPYVNGVTAPQAFITDDNNANNGYGTFSTTNGSGASWIVQQTVANAWPTAPAASPGFDDDSVIAVNNNTSSTTASGGTATWTITPGQMGQYELYVYVPAPGVNQTPIPDAQYTWTAGASSGSFTVNQATNFGNWYDTGTLVTLATGDTLSVTMRSSSSYVSLSTFAVDPIYDAAASTANTGPYYWDPTSTTTLASPPTQYYTVEVRYPQAAAPNNVLYSVEANGLPYSANTPATLSPVSSSAVMPVQYNGGSINQGASNSNRWTQLDMIDASGNELLAVPFDYVAPQPPLTGTLDTNNTIELASVSGSANVRRGNVRITPVTTVNVTASGVGGTVNNGGWTPTSSYFTSQPTTAPATSVTFQWAPNLTDVPQYYNVLVHIPAAAGIAGTFGIPDAVYTLVAAGVNYTSGTLNQQAAAGKWVALRDATGKLLAAPFAKTGDTNYNYLALSNSSNVAYSSTSPTLVYADTVCFVPVPGTYYAAADAVKLVGNGLTVDNTDGTSVLYREAGSWNTGPSGSINGTDFYGKDFRYTTSSGATATWYPTLSQSGQYSVYAWFPSNTKTERNVTNALYDIHVGGGASDVTATIDQSYGGSWQFIAGPITFPYTVGSTDLPYVTVSSTSASSSSVLVADAIQLVNEGASGATFSSAAVANITDYPELFYGYDFSNMATVMYDPTTFTAGPTNSPREMITTAPVVMPGGGYPNYIATALANGVSDATQPPVVHNNNIPPASLNPQPATTTSPPYVTANPCTVTSANATAAITQLVYFTRNENTSQSLSAQVISLTNATGGTFALTYGAQTTVSLAYNCTAAQVQAALAALSSIGSGNVTVSGSQGGPFVVLFSSSLGNGQVALLGYNSSLTGTGVSMTIVASAGATEAGAVYCVDGLTGNVVWKFPDDATPVLERPGVISSTPVILRNVLTRVNQPWNESGDPGYIKTPGGKLVPTGQVNSRAAGAFGTFDSTDGYVYQPGWTAGATTLPTNSTTGATWPSASAVYPSLAAIDPTGDVYQPRTVVVVADDNGKMFCIDAAGNGDGNDIVLDGNGNPVSFNANGPIGSASGTLKITHVGTTRCYWCWQPDQGNPIVSATQYIVDDSAPDSSGTPVPGTGWGAVTSPYGLGYLNNFHTFTGVGTGSNPFTWKLDGVPTGSYNVWVSIPGLPNNSANAQYAINGVPISSTISQQVEGTAWICLGAYSVGGSGSTITLSDFAVGQTTTTTLVADAVLLQPTSLGDTIDGTRNLVAPGAFQLNSATARLDQDTVWGGVVAANPNISPSIVYNPTLYIGNSNGYLYAIDGKGTLANFAGTSSTVGISPVNPNVYDLSLDETFPTVAMKWWYNTGDSIAYAPVYDPLDDMVLVTTYNSVGNNQGRLYAVNADFGPLGNGGQVPASQLSQISGSLGSYITPVPDTYQYNVNPIPYWSFPDKFGTVTDTNNQSLIYDFFPTTYPWQMSNYIPVHLMTSKATDASGNATPVLPLGDCAGAPALYTLPASNSLLYNSSRNIYIACNDPLTNNNGRIMCLNTSGQFQWSFPHTVSVTTGGTSSADPNACSLTSTQTSMFTPDSSGSSFVIDGAFTTQLSTPPYYASSSPAIGLITAPSSDPYDVAPYGFASGTLQDDTTDVTTPVLYVGNTNGNLYELALAYSDGSTMGNSATDDSNRIFGIGMTYGSSAIVSAPVVLSGSAGQNASPGSTVVGKRGGTVWFNGADDGTTETEAAPYTYAFTPVYGNRDANLGGDADAQSRPGGVSSPAIAGFDISPLTTQHTGTSVGQIQTDISEWLYSGSDAGEMFGFTAAATIGSGSGAGVVDIPGMIPPENSANIPPLSNMSRNLITAVSPDGATGPATGSSGTDATKFSWYRNYSPVKVGHASPYAITTSDPDPSTNPNPVTEWGQTFYVKVFGVDSATATGTSVGGVPDPKGLYVKFSLSNISTGGVSSYLETRTIPASQFQQIGGTSGDLSGWWVPSWLGTGTAKSQMGSYVAIYPVVLGNGAAATLTPTLKIKVTNAEYHYLLNGKEYIIRAHVDPGTVVNNGNGGLSLTTPIDQATFAILNPLAVRGAGLPFDNTSAAYHGAQQIGIAPASATNVPDNNTSIYNIGPFQSFDDMVPGPTLLAGYNVYKFASSNGNNVPLNTSPPGGGTMTLSNPTGGTVANPIVTNPKTTLTMAGGAVAYYQMIVATTTDGVLGHGTSGDNTTTTVLAADGLPTTNLDPQTSTDGTFTPPVLETTSNPGFGLTLLNVADRSALGTMHGSITTLRMTPTKLGWNDNSSYNGIGSIVNYLPWDAKPISYKMGQTNFNYDYPDISQNAVGVGLQQRTSGQDGAIPGTSAPLLTAPGSLDSTNDTVSSTNNRVVYPQSVAVTVAVPKYQPANLEAYRALYVADGLATNGENRLHPNVATGDTPPQDFPNGYVGQAKLYVDSGNTGNWTMQKAYRQVQIWTAVQADTNSISIDQPTTDIGAVPVGFGIENPLTSIWAVTAAGNTTQTAANANSAAWSPFSALSASPYSYWYKPITAHSGCNVNLINVHFDQMIDRSTYAATTSTAAGPYPVTTSGYTNPQALSLVSDATSGNSFIPSVDTVGGLSGGLTAGTAAGAGLQPIIRSSLDYFDQNAVWYAASNVWADSTSGSPYEPWWNTYIPNTAEIATNTVYGSTTSQPFKYPGPTWHKPRVGDSATWGTTLTVPDQPHDAGHPMTTSAVRGANPTLSVAVPLGTPTGTYYQSLRLFEGADPVPFANTGVSSAYTGPLYGGQAVPINAKSNLSPFAFSLDKNTGSALQPYSQTPTQLKVTVTEAQVTGGSTQNARIEDAGGNNLNASLPMVDFDPNVGNIESLTAISGNMLTSTALPTPLANNLQPVGFPACTTPPIPTGTATVAASAIGLAWTSARYDWAGQGTTQKQYHPFDVFGSSVPTTLLNGTVATSTAPATLGLGSIVDTASRATTATSTLTTTGEWWSAPLPVTQYGYTAKTTPGTPPAQAYDPFVLVSSDGTANKMIHVEAVSNALTNARATTYSIIQQSIVGADFTTLGAGTTLVSGSQQIFHPRAVFWYDATSSKTYEIVIWSQRVNGLSSLMYCVYDPSPATGNPSVSTPAVLPTPASLSDIGDASLQVRYLITSLGGSTSWTTDVPGANTVTNIGRYLDLTYAGRSEHSATTDIFTSRYTVSVSETSVAGWSLSLATMSPHNGFVTQNLSATSVKAVYAGQDATWQRDPTKFNLYLKFSSTSSGTTTTIYEPLIGQAGGTNAPSTVTYKTDPSSGEWVFTGVPVIADQTHSVACYWNHNANDGTGVAQIATMTVMVDPYAGTVQFSVPPDVDASDSYHLTASICADVIPMALRITHGGGANSQACAFLDDAPKPNASVNLNTVQTARYWYIYRKSGPDSTGSSTAMATLYYNTRRLSIPLSYPISLATVTPVAVNPPVVIVSDGTTTQNVSAYVDVDWERGRIYFPEQFEGLSATVTYKAFEYAASGSTVMSGVATTGTILWQDEPYSNTPQDAATVTSGTPAIALLGERAVPIYNAVNEGEPSAFLDPASGLVSGNGALGQLSSLASFYNQTTLNNPHKIWLFWSSNRNAGNYNATPLATSLATSAAAGATTFQVSIANVPASVLTAITPTTPLNCRIGRGSGAEDVVVTGIDSSGNVTLSTGSSLVNAHGAGAAFGSVRYNNYVGTPTSTAATAQPPYWKPIVDNPDSWPPAANQGEWILYTGMSDVYWQALDPRFQLSP